MWPTFCLACLFVFVTSSPTFQVSGHRFFGVVNRVISELWSTARWRECRRQVDKTCKNTQEPLKKQMKQKTIKNGKTLKKPINQSFWSLDAAQVGWAGAHPSWAVPKTPNDSFIGFFNGVLFSLFCFLVLLVCSMAPWCFLHNLLVSWRFLLVFRWIGWQAG